MFAIALDGPAGAGKSSVAKSVAKKLKIIYVDTGALYRAIGLHACNQGVSLDDTDGIISLLEGLTIDLSFENGTQAVLLNGEDVSDLIRTPEVSMAASKVSAIPKVREFLFNTQRDIAKHHSVIMDGRDIGTVVLPDAKYKIFLTASPEVRADRRYKELTEKGMTVNYDDILKDIIERDNNDSNRAVAPLKAADDAILLNTDNLNFEQVVLAVLDIVKKGE